MTETEANATCDTMLDRLEKLVAEGDAIAKEYFERDTAENQFDWGVMDKQLERLNKISASLLKIREGLSYYTHVHTYQQGRISDPEA